MQETILLVEDDQSVSALLVKELSQEGFQVIHSENGKQAREKFSEKVDLILLDWMLPDIQGIDLLKEWQQKDLQIPVIMLTARVDVFDKVLGLEMGASDYITKPFHPRELIARVRVQLRGSSDKKPLNKNGAFSISIGPFQIDKTRRELFFKEQKVELTQLEFDLLYFLAESPERVFSRDELLDSVWGYESYVSTRTVDNSILQLRKKTATSHFETVRGVGYRFLPLPTENAS